MATEACAQNGVLLDDSERAPSRLSRSEARSLVCREQAGDLDTIPPVRDYY